MDREVHRERNRMNRTGGTARKPAALVALPPKRDGSARRAALWMAGVAPFAIAIASVAGGGTGGVGGGGGAGVVLSNKDLFEQTVLPGLEANCVPCHVNGGFADFL